MLNFEQELSACSLILDPTSLFVLYEVGNGVRASVADFESDFEFEAPLEILIDSLSAEGFLEVDAKGTLRVTDKGRFAIEGLSQGPARVSRIATPAIAAEDAIIAEDTRMRQLLRTARQLAEADPLTILITGESGTGKTALAHYIYAQSRRAGKPFREVNVVALPEPILESELFGHAAAAFTGARTARAGILEAIAGGTIFLDEIDGMDAKLQVKFLRFLQEREIWPIGAGWSIPADVRVLAASNRDLRAEVEARRFREDLFYRLSAITMSIPPLRERRSDIVALTMQFLKEVPLRFGLSPVSITDEALAALAAYRWPGHVRELRNTIEMIVILRPEHGTVTIADLPFGHSGRARWEVAAESLGDRLSSAAVLGEFERKLIAATLERVGGNRKAAARELGVSTAQLKKLLRENAAAFAQRPGKSN